MRTIYQIRLFYVEYYLSYVHFMVLIKFALWDAFVQIFGYFTQVFLSKTACSAVNGHLVCSFYFLSGLFVRRVQDIYILL